MTTTVLGDRIGNRVVSYGFSGAGYETDVPEFFKKKGVECLTYIKLQQNWDVDIYRGYESYLLEGVGARNVKSAFWKVGLVNLVLDNYQKSLQGLPITPCLFCIEADGIDLSITYLLDNRYHPTSKEVRRAYKLCRDERLPKEIRDVAERTFIFIRVNQKNIRSGNKNPDECFTPLDFPWDTKEGKNCVERFKYRERVKTIRHGFWRSAAIDFYMRVTPPQEQTIPEKTGSDAFSHLRSIPHVIREERGNQALELISQHLQERKRDQAIEALNQIVQFEKQQEGVRKIVAYDLKKSPPNYDGAAELAWSERYGRPRYEGGLGCPEAQRLIIDKVAEEGEDGVFTARLLIDQMIPNSHHKEDGYCSCYPCSAKASVDRIERRALLKLGAAKGTPSSSK